MAVQARMVEEAAPASGLILIVEDDERSRKLLRDLLQFYGYRTIEAETGEDAIDLAHSELPQLILMDIRLPGMDGEKALVQLRADPATADIPIVAVTASAMRGDEQHLRQVGFDGYIPKPVDIVALPEIVAQFFAR